MRRFAAILTLLLLAIPSLSFAQNLCPPGSLPVPIPQGYQCRCSDGSYASIYGCSQIQQPQANYCGNNQSCPLGTECCLAFNQCCTTGTYCSSQFGCIPRGSISCGSGYCNPGSVCVNDNGSYKCPNYQQYAVRIGNNIGDWLAKNNARIADSYQVRNEKALEYVRDNTEVQNSIKSILAKKGMLGVCQGSDKCATVIDTVLSAGNDAVEFGRGEYYVGSLHMVNQGSSALLSYLLPYGGTMADAIDLAGAVATAYVYGFFWRQNTPSTSWTPRKAKGKLVNSHHCAHQSQIPGGSENMCFRAPTQIRWEGESVRARFPSFRIWACTRT